MNDIIAFYFSLWWFKSASQDETRDIIKGRKYRQEGVKRGQADCKLNSGQVIGFLYRPLLCFIIGLGHIPSTFI